VLCIAACFCLQLQFGRGPHGKPFLQPCSASAADQALAGRLQFNLAHTQSVISEQAIEQCSCAVQMYIVIVQCNSAVQLCSAIVQCNCAMQSCSAIVQCNCAMQLSRPYAVPAALAGAVVVLVVSQLYGSFPSGDTCVTRDGMCMCLSWPGVQAALCEPTGYACGCTAMCCVSHLGIY
jgi:hypothetical protein